MTESRFRDLIERRAITFTDCNGALRAIALGVCDYLVESTGCPTQLSGMKVSKETVDATGSTLWCAISCGKSNCPGSTGKVAISTRGAGIITCSRLFLTHRFSLGCRVFSAVPA